MPAATKTQIDFRPLEGLRKIRNESNDYLSYAIMLIIGSSLFFMLTLKPVYSLTLFIGGAIWIITLFLSDSSSKRHNDIVLTEFAHINDFEYAIPPESFDTIPGTLFKLGHSKKVNELISGEIDGYPFNLFRYDYTTGSGKSERSYDAAVMEIILPRILPHMIIDSLVEEGNGQTSTLPINFDRSQRLQLEGDFYKYFDLYAPDKYGITALTIIAPDAMEVLMSHAGLCDIEIIDHSMYLYWPIIIEDREGYEESFDTAQTLLSEIGKKLSRGDIYSQPAQAQIHAEAANHGVRLKENKFSLLSTLAIIGGFVAYIYFHEETQNKVIQGVIIISIYLPIVLLTMWRKYKKQTLLSDLQRRYEKYHSLDKSHK